MARRPGVYGPYPHGHRFRIIVVDERGAQDARSFTTETEAREYRAAVVRELHAEAGITVIAALDTYELHQRGKGNKTRTIDTTMQRLRSFFADLIDLPIVTLTLAQCSKAYEQLRAKVAIDTHRNTLNQARTFLRWCVSKGYAKRNPLLDVVGEGKRKKGKPQLRIDEARKWMSEAVRRGHTGDVQAAAAATALLLGMRSTEIASREVRDLDDGARLLWIPDSKTEAGKRQVETPEPLRPFLVALAKGKLPTAPLFDGVTRHTLYHHVRSICDAAGVPLVCTHSLRGLHSTLAIEAGATGHLVAASLGHSSFAITEQHYVNRERGEQAKNRTAVKVLTGGKRGKN